ncbi:hypothetical protein [Leptospira weilii]|uniref:hypothetical protein n=1 Tax=Leptospira weilii TaxID=28184 RepID=UPI00115B48C7|nr:hypothetical protein [Leptospira weilii]QDK24654.1 hypothetical protein FHG67_01960 [Leptospira weilii]QDK24656.1 hypothetical protein FHG67_02045 [Leptospira weilii]QDK28669.1 hypothetical protein FHG68_06450 [Leptospira weilii]
MEAELEEEIAREQEILTKCKRRLEEPDLSEEDMKEVLETILENEFHELEGKLGRVSGRYKGSEVYGYIEIVRAYLKQEANTLVNGFQITDAGALYFLMRNLQWCLNEFPDVSLLLCALKYHARNQEPIEDKKRRKEYIRLYRYTIHRTIGILIDISEALEVRDFVKDEDLEKLMIYWRYEILEQFSKIYATRKESPYYKKLGWFKRWALGGYVTRARDTLYMYSSKKGELEKSKSANEKQGGSNKKRKRRR